MDFAWRESRILITLDKDCGELAVVFGRPHCGVVRLVDLDPRQQPIACVPPRIPGFDTTNPPATVLISATALMDARLIPSRSKGKSPPAGPKAWRRPSRTTSVGCACGTSKVASACKHLRATTTGPGGLASPSRRTAGSPPRSVGTRLFVCGISKADGACAHSRSKVEGRC